MKCQRQKKDLENSEKTEGELYLEQLRSGVVFTDEEEKLVCPGGDLFGDRLDGLSLHGAVLDGADIGYASLVGTDLSRAQINEASLIGARLELARLDNASLCGSVLSEAILDAAFLQGADFTDASLEDAHGHEIRACGARLVNADARNARLAGADLRNADLTRANLTGADLSGSDLRGAILIGVQLTGACLRGADLTGAQYGVAELKKADLSYAAGVPDGVMKNKIRPVRFGPGGPSPELDRQKLHKIITDLSSLLEQKPDEHADRVIDHFERELSLFTELQVPLSIHPGDFAASQLGLITGGYGPALHEKIVREMQCLCVPSDRRELITYLSENTGFCPAGFKTAITGGRSEFQVYFRGPLGLSEVAYHLNHLNLSSMKVAAEVFQKAAEVMDRRHIHFLAFECSPGRPMAVEAYWTNLINDGGALPRLAAITGLSWNPPKALEILLEHAHWPLYTSLAVVDGKIVQSIKLDLQVRMEQIENVFPLLSDARSRQVLLSISEKLYAQEITLEHVGIRLGPGQKTNVSVYVRPARNPVSRR